MGYVYLACSPDDGDAVGPLAEMLRGAGWGVRFGNLAEHGHNSRDRIAAEIRGASAVLAIWSSNSVDSPGVRAAAESAHQRGILIAIRIDAAWMPLAGGNVVDLSDGQGLSSGPGAKAILNAIAALPRLPSKSVADQTPGLAGETKRSPAGNKRRGLVAVAALAVMGALGLGLTAFLNQPTHDGEAVAELAGGPSAVRLESDHLEALRLWGGLAKDDPMALRAFIASYGAAPVGEQARGALSRLERMAWSDLEARDDAAGILEALEVYRAEFPDGQFGLEASEIERRERERIAEAQQLLKAAGLAHAEADGVMKPDTLAAVRTFQANVGLHPTGLIDAALMQALKSAGALERPSAPAAASGAAPVAAAEPAPASPIAEVAAAAAPIRDCYVCPEIIPLPVGRFQMGDATGVAPADERPAHAVVIAYRVALGRYEVTFEEWDACHAEGGCRHRPTDAGRGRGARPVVDVSPADITEYLAWLTRKTGKRYRLPSEAEWEYGARAGAPSAWHSGNDPAVLCNVANGADASSTYAWRNPSCSDRFAREAAPVGSFLPNAFGLHDVAGNVWEWTADCWHSSYAGAPSDGSAWTTTCDSSDRVLRGGAYSVEIDKLRSSYRYHFAPKRMPFFGFRVARLID